jgi:hypothetical protein
VRDGSGVAVKVGDGEYVEVAVGASTVSVGDGRTAANGVLVGADVSVAKSSGVRLALARGAA